MLYKEELMINIINWEKVISDCKYDSNVGIKIAKLAGEDSFSTFITVIDAGKSVNPHYHKRGDEHYHILSGKGQVYLKNMLTLEECIFLVSAHESFVVPENTLHKLTNTGDDSLTLMFSCPNAHLESDRYFL